MISFGQYQYSRKVEDKTLYFCEGVCMSTDAKPTSGIENGSRMIEMDTGKIYFFDIVSKEWKEFK